MLDFNLFFLAEKKVETIFYSVAFKRLKILKWFFSTLSILMKRNFLQSILFLTKIWQDEIFIKIVLIVYNFLTKWCNVGEYKVFTFKYIPSYYSPRISLQRHYRLLTALIKVQVTYNLRFLFLSPRHDFGLLFLCTLIDWYM